MSLIFWLKSLKKSRRRSLKANERARRLTFNRRRLFEPLEERSLLATIMVTSLADNTTGGHRA